MTKAQETTVNALELSAREFLAVDRVEYYFPDYYESYITLAIVNERDKSEVLYKITPEGKATFNGVRFETPKADANG